MPPGRPEHKIPIGISFTEVGKGPGWSPKPKGLSKIQSMGLAFERKVVKHLGALAYHGLWVRYTDLNGSSWCQPDIIIRDWYGPGARRPVTVVLECKLSYTPNGHLQLEELYLPVMEHLLGQPAIGVVVSRNMTRTTPIDQICATLPHALSLAANGNRSIWHWLG